jgi:hypothetical protein
MLNKGKRVALFLDICEENHDVEPLYFTPSVDTKLRSKLEGNSLEDILYEILCLTRTYNTFTKKSGDELGASAQTESNRRRSALDMWRIAQGVGLNVSLSEVMESLYKLCMKENRMYVSLCSTVGRRVFRVREDVGQGGGTSTNAWDEFGIVFDDWATITKPETSEQEAVYKMYDPNGRNYRERFHSEFRNGTPQGGN